jgi:hypothetical protein
MIRNWSFLLGMAVGELWLFTVLVAAGVCHL